MISLVITASTGLYQLGWIVYLMHLWIFAFTLFILTPVAKTLMVHNFKHISGMASGIGGGSTNIIATLIAGIANKFFDGKTSSPNS